MTFPTSMAEALRLTRSGNLMEATAVIQKALRMGAAAQASARDEPGEVIDLVAERVSLAPPSQTADAGGQPARGSDADARFEQRTYRGAEGAMRYMLYRPAGAKAGMPLIVMLHGCTQSPEDFARGTGMNRIADEFGFLVAYPRQSRRANPQKCWNWFRPGDQQRDRGEPALLAGITREIIAEHGVDTSRVYIAGLSAGGAAAAVMAAEYPDVFAAVGIHSGIACGTARDVPSALAVMKRGAGVGGAGRAAFVPVITFHGDRDSTVHEINSCEIVAAASAAAGKPLEVRIESGRAAGRAFSRSLSVDPDGVVLIEQWTVEGSGHAWSGGDKAGSYADPAGPDASREMARFFLTKRGGPRGGMTATLGGVYHAAG